MRWRDLAACICADFARVICPYRLIDSQWFNCAGFAYCVVLRHRKVALSRLDAGGVPITRWRSSERIHDHGFFPCVRILRALRSHAFWTACDVEPAGCSEPGVRFAVEFFRFIESWVICPVADPGRSTSAERSLFQPPRPFCAQREWMIPTL